MNSVLGHQLIQVIKIWPALIDAVYWANLTGWSRHQKIAERPVATSHDYSGKQFGDFLIGDRIGRGAEAEVLLCLHQSTGQPYALRLPINDDALWDGPPLIPPQNGSIEWPNARGTWLVTPHYYLHSLEELKKGDDSFKIQTAAIYGVLENRYLVPVASPVRLKGVKDVDEILELAPPDDLWLFATWESILGALILEAHQQGDVAQKWPLLVGGSILEQAAVQYMRGGTLSSGEQAAIRRALGGPAQKTELAENLLLRIAGCVERGRLSADQVLLLFQCRHFRINVTEHDTRQMIQAYQLLKKYPVGSDDERGLMGGILNLLTDQPVDPFDQPDLFEVRTEEPDPTRFPLLLQEYVASRQPVLSLNRS